ncbi:uncharacterized protein BP5553_01390 [Venustampulla echinocandica]|uniref:Zn(2)-C6 fungal-type domain-containing protein n=1 Tax=Venustampulla echinocandica TaxID=2656787 RepID=A0A370U0V6_9HELO|nr:uncharacterized protein BP5553_01390 [Venustampulla echinocandica]RDL41411.1 hypothetical protein BP5553_01390 [Venustampulla echinocandica]
MTAARDSSNYASTVADMLWEDGLAEGMGYLMSLVESEKQSSDVETSSFVDVGPGSMIPTGMGSWAMVRAGSHGSNQTSGHGSENLAYSVPSQGSGEWIPGTECGVVMEADEENDRSMPHDQEVILSSMFQTEPMQVYNPYLPGPILCASEDIYMGQETNQYMQQEPNHYMSSLAVPPGTQTQASIPSTMLHYGSEPPWTAVTHPRRAPSHEPGYAVFAPSPGPAAEQDPEELRHGVASSLVVCSEATKRKRKTKEQEWKHHSIIRRGGVQLMKVPDEPKSQRPGVRKGRLDPQVAENARKVRKLTACWNCWMQKVTCSDGETCVTCKRSFGLSATQLCFRSHFEEYQEVFYPEYLHAHLKKRKIEDLVTENTNGFTDTVLEIEIGVGACFTPMRLLVNVFRPTSRELLTQHRLVVDGEVSDSPLVLQESVAVGLLGVSPSDMSIKCEYHIIEMIESCWYAAQVTAGDTSRIPYVILDIAQQYYASTRASLVRQVLMLHAIRYYMKSLVTLSEESASVVYSSLPDSPPYYSQTAYPCSRLLNRQIKYAMDKLSREITRKVLQGLERTMRSRLSWGPSFCVLLLLCLCMEELEIAAHIFVVSDIEKEGAKSAYNRRQSSTACQILEDNPFLQFKRLFHDIYRTHGGSRRGPGFNPLRSVAKHGGCSELDPPGDRMVQSIYQMICGSYDEIIVLSENPPLVDMGDRFDPEIIKKNNTGRLVAKFLRSFFPADWSPPIKS